MVFPLAMTLRFEATDMALVTGTLALFMIVAEAGRYFAWGRLPGWELGRHILKGVVAAAVGIPLLIFAKIMGALLLGYIQPRDVPLPPHADIVFLAIIGALLIVWAFRSYWSTTSPISRPIRALLTALRVAAILLLLAYLLRPTIYHITPYWEKATLVMIYDTSKSMTIKDAGADGHSARADALCDALEKNAKGLDRLRDSFDVRQFVFDERGGAEVTDPVKPLRAPTSGPDSHWLETTAIGAAVRDACRQSAGPKIAGVLVFTDGSENGLPAGDAVRAAQVLAGQAVPVPVWPVGVGAEQPPTDRPLAVIKELSLSDHKIPAFNVLTVHVVYDLINLPNTPVKIELVIGEGSQERLADSKVITAEGRTADGKPVTQVSADLQVTPTQAGFHPVTVRVAADAKADDNDHTPLASAFGQRTDYVQVNDDLIQVLYVEGKWRYEAEFIISAIGGSDLMRLNRQFIVSTDALAGGVASQWPKNEAEWMKYHVIIIGNVKANLFSADELRIIHKMVADEGKGLVMLGGSDTFGQGGWPDSPIADLFPFDLHQAVGQIPDKFKMVATPAGLDHPLMQLVDKADEGKAADPNQPDNAAAWAMLPDLQGADKFPDAKTILAAHAGAIILATTPAGQPVMVAQQAGKGRVLAMAIDTTWRWRLHDMAWTRPLPVDIGARWHNHFWRQIALWMAGRDTETWVRCEQPSYRLIGVRKADGGEDHVVKDPILVTASMVDKFGKPVGAKGKPKLTLVRPDGKADAPIDMANHFKGDLFKLELPRPPTVGGNYKLLFEGEIDDKPVKAETSFLVETIDLELAPPQLANYALLRQMADVTANAGGQFYVLNDLDKLLERFKSSDYLIRREKQDKTDIGDEHRWPILVIIFALLLAEWVVRKRSALV